MSTKTHTYKNDTGFIRIDDDSIVNGVIDIDSVEKLVSGARETLTYFMKKEDSDLNAVKSLNFPIQTREGCWELLVPVFTYAAGTATGALAKGLNAYAVRYGTLRAEQRFDEKDTTQIYRDAFAKLQSVIKIAQHLDTVSNKKALNIKQVDMKKGTGLLINDKGNVLSVTMEEVSTFSSCPDRILRSIASVVTDRRTVSIGYHYGGKTHQEVIDIESKSIFAPDEDTGEAVLPDLHEGEYVELVGYVRRGNQRTNTIGFEYEGHILTCEPNKRLITGFINQHYKKCKISGVVQRTTQAEVANGKSDRPRIFFDDLIIIEEPRMIEQTELLGIE